MKTKLAPSLIYRRIGLDEAGEVSSGRIQIEPELVESALDRVAQSDDASFPLGGQLDQAVERSNGSGADS